MTWWQIVLLVVGIIYAGCLTWGIVAFVRDVYGWDKYYKEAGEKGASFVDVKNSFVSFVLFAPLFVFFQLPIWLVLWVIVFVDRLRRNSNAV